ncbi:glucose-1-phosphate thymidylyltransferase [Nibribacter ruber]|uniref:Glucose-1-phosphate thymidylyltransferase n=1 Tax=Nibribacter ruber TaxID=2698458 RepID=A0A6P1P3R6_9BACT|nr:GlmU family protein [Nibribacter ruber]QHL88976.1 glucose-1-phosphate thymidylyltransferase [Nibribacter ruber]
MNIILFDDPALRANLLPFTYTRPVADIRVGIQTISEKWAYVSQGQVSFLTQDYLQQKFAQQTTDANLYVNGALCPTEGLFGQVQQLKEGQALYAGETLLAVHAGAKTFASIEDLYATFSEEKVHVEEADVVLVENSWDIFRINGAQIKADFARLTKGRTSQPINDEHTIVYAPENIFIEEGVKIRAAILNAEDGPIYLGKNSQVHEGAIIKGPFALGEGSNVNMGGKMRGDITIGPFCKVGGEVSNCVFFGFSNKGHEGFLGNSVVGEWCNFGADTNTSNLKNNYAKVKLWHHTKERFVDTGLQFCGLMMADHAKCGINTMFNTGTVVGVGANVFGAGYPRNFIPSFSWGGVTGYETFQLRKAFEVAQVVLERRGLPLTDEDKNILTHVFEQTKPSRTWEKTA